MFFISQSNQFESVYLLANQNANTQGQERESLQAVESSDGEVLAARGTRLAYYSAERWHMLYILQQFYVIRHFKRSSYIVPNMAVIIISTFHFFRQTVSVPRD